MQAILAIPNKTGHALLPPLSFTPLIPPPLSSREESFSSLIPPPLSSRVPLRCPILLIFLFDQTMAMLRRRYEALPLFKGYPNGDPDPSAPQSKSCRRIDANIGCTMIAAIVMHAPGLTSQIKFSEQLLTMLGALIGSVSEGVFVLLLLSMILRHASKSFQEANVQTNFGPCAWFASKGMLCFISAALYLVAFVAFTAADYTFQNMSGGTSPNMWIVANGIANSVDVGRQLASDKENDGSTNVYFVCFSLCVALAIYCVGQRMSRTETVGKEFGASSRMKRNRCLLAAGSLAVVVYSLGAWSPVMHSYLSFIGSFIFTAPGANIAIAKEAVTEDITNHAQGPNVIFMVPDSLSGAYASTGEKKMTRSDSPTSALFRATQSTRSPHFTRGVCLSRRRGEIWRLVGRLEANSSAKATRLRPFQRPRSICKSVFGK